MHQTLQQQFKEINNSTLHNMRFLLESYSNEVINAIDQQIATEVENSDDDIHAIRREVSSVIRTLKGMQTVINHNTYIHKKEAS